MRNYVFACLIASLPAVCEETIQLDSKVPSSQLNEASSRKGLFCYANISDSFFGTGWSYRIHPKRNFGVSFDLEAGFGIYGILHGRLSESNLGPALQGRGNVLYYMIDKGTSPYFSLGAGVDYCFDVRRNQVMRFEAPLRFGVEMPYGFLDVGISIQPPGSGQRELYFGKQARAGLGFNF